MWTRQRRDNQNDNMQLRPAKGGTTVVPTTSVPIPAPNSSSEPHLTPKFDAVGIHRGVREMFGVRLASGTIGRHRLHKQPKSHPKSVENEAELDPRSTKWLPVALRMGTWKNIGSRGDLVAVWGMIFGAFWHLWPTLVVMLTPAAP